MLVAPIPYVIPLVPQFLEWNQRFDDNAEVIQSTCLIQRQSNIASVANGSILATMPYLIIQKVVKTIAAKGMDTAKRHMGNLKQVMYV